MLAIDTVLYRRVHARYVASGAGRGFVAFDWPTMSLGWREAFSRAGYRGPRHEYLWI